MRRTATLLVGVAAVLATGDAGAAITIYPRVGNSADSTVAPQGPGLVIMGGGTDVDRAFVWMHDTIAGSASAVAGDVVVLRATGDNAYDSYIAGLAPFNSVETLLIPTPASASDLSMAAAIVDKAEVVFFAGGNQADYVGWKGSPLLTAVAACHQRGGIVGGTSAGAAILGQFVYDAVAAGSTNVATADAVANPYEPAISFTRGLLPFSLLDGAVTDPHFVVRDRFGRLAAFMARQLADGTASGMVHGIGVDEKAALCIDKNGLAVLEQLDAGTGSAFVATGGPAAVIQAGKPLRYPGLTVTRLDQQGQTYDIAHWCGTTTTYSLSVDGTMTPVYAPQDPYTAAGAAGSCNVTGSIDMSTSPTDGSVAPFDAAVGPADAGIGAGGNGGSSGGNGGFPGGPGTGGCGCRIAGRSSDAPSLALVLGVVLVLALARLRHRAATPR